ncbi:methyl-accepting chemotaxis protein [Bacillus suaedaesalsae]|uniref:Methyl-accepting chemotaxis protein n=1 Tax=Bacillus suaedaesalsae TaxID=2810349 RepID=A0ABS2DEX0_9BACI|nr:methyl-accepting chemotaxis protein [Bacillus suaedaesalsae]MBM6617012.1 methyl-accepting chemotaxis protein [Bacillus suaedaesalsae]
MKKTLTWQLGRIIIGVIFASLLITSVATYKTAYDKLYDAAGIEAYGCANITTGLLDPSEVEKLTSGDFSLSEKVGSSLNWTTEHKGIFEAQYILDMNGTLLAIDDNMKEDGFVIGDMFYMDEEAISMMLEMKHPTYSEPYEAGGITRLSGYAPIFKDHDSSKEVIAISVIDFDTSIVTERTWDVVSGGLLIGIIPMIIASLFTIYLLRRKTKPISIIIEHSKQIAAGNLALEKLNISSKDEVGELAETINTMTENLHEIVTVLKSSSEKLAQNAETNSLSLQEMNSAIQQVTSSMSEVAIDTASGTEDAVNAVTTLHELAKSILSTKDIAVSSVHDSENTLQSAKLGKEKVIEISGKMDGIKDVTLSTEQVINKLNTYTSQIRTITEAINGIAGQTNLLALNASIEAARAGEHGKGFAVVADEVRKLAEQSNKEVATVEQLVHHITKGIEEAVTCIHESITSVEQGEIAVKETGVALEHILNDVSKTVNDLSKIGSVTSEEAETSEQTVAKIQQLVKSIENIAAYSEEVAASAEQTSASLEEITYRSNETVELSTKLKEIVQKFTI